MIFDIEGVIVSIIMPVERGGERSAEARPFPAKSLIAVPSKSELDMIIPSASSLPGWTVYLKVRLDVPDPLVYSAFNTSPESIVNCTFGFLHTFLLCVTYQLNHLEFHLPVHHTQWYDFLWILFHLVRYFVKIYLWHALR